MAENRVIKEIVCLKSIMQETGKPRVLKPTDFEDGLHWERQVEAAMGDPASYEIHRETVYTEEDEAQDLSTIDIKDMTTMSRERVSDIAVKAYGIKDEGQTRSTLIDQIVAEKEKQADILRRAQTSGRTLGDGPSD
jgi:hypothetical protein